MGSQALPPVTVVELVSLWQFAPVVTAFAVLAAGLYLWGVLRVRRRHPARPWPWYRTALFLAGLAVIVIATESGVGSYDDVLFWDHMIQHLLLLMVAPPLLVVGQPVTLLLHASRNPVHTWTKKLLRSHAVTWITWPPFGVALYLGVIVGTHLTGFMNVVLSNDAAHQAEHVLFLVAGSPELGAEPAHRRAHRRRGDVGGRSRPDVRGHAGGVLRLEPRDGRRRRAGLARDRAPGELRRASRRAPGGRRQPRRPGAGRPGQRGQERRRRRAPGRVQCLPGPPQRAARSLNGPRRDTPVGLSSQI